MRIREWRREFVTGTHLSSDVFFTVRKVTQEPRYIFDAYLPGFQAGSNFMLFGLFESWGASGAFLYVVFGLTSRYWNSWHFNQQVAGIDIRKLDRHQFTQHGRLIDKSFQMPREFQCMSAD
jgi:hypothetical protein